MLGDLDPLRKLARDTEPELVVMYNFCIAVGPVSDLICVTIPGPNHTDFSRIAAPIDQNHQLYTF